MDLGLRDRVAVVAGASRGLGRATAEALIGEGAKVVALSRSAEDLSRLEESYPGQVVGVSADLLDPATPERAVKVALEKFGRLDILIVNTPGPPRAEPLAVSDDDFQQAFATAFYPAVRLIRAGLGPLRENRWGRIIIISSTSVKAPKSFLTLSATARSALWAWAKSAAPELNQDGITINAVFAGPHRTARMAELGRSEQNGGNPEDFGALVATLCGTSTAFVTGSGYVLDGGEMRGLL